MSIAVGVWLGRKEVTWWTTTESQVSCEESSGEISKERRAGDGSFCC